MVVFIGPPESMEGIEIEEVNDIISVENEDKKGEIEKIYKIEYQIYFSLFELLSHQTFYTYQNEVEHNKREDIFKHFINPKELKKFNKNRTFGGLDFYPGEIVGCFFFGSNGKLSLPKWFDFFALPHNVVGLSPYRNIFNGFEVHGGQDLRAADHPRVRGEQGRFPRA